MSDLSSEEKWLNKRLTKPELLHLVTSILRRPEDSGNPMEWAVESAKHNTEQQRAMGNMRCFTCDRITRKLTE